MADSLNLTAQSFIPGILEYEGDKRVRSRVLNQTVRNFLKAAFLFGAGLTGLVSCMPLVSKLFSHDPLVVASANAATPYLAFIFALSGFVCTGEGLLLGQKELGFLSKSYFAFLFAVPYFLLKVKKAALMGTKGIGIASLWKTFSVYQLIRCFMWMLRVSQVSLQKGNSAKDDDDYQQRNVQMSSIPK